MTRTPLLFLLIVTCCAGRPVFAENAVGTFPWISVLCKYADIFEEPQDAAFVEEMFGDSPGAINHYWKEASYGRSSLAGSRAVGWYTLPQPRAAYFIGTDPEEPDVQKIVRDCARAADADVDFSNFYGINVLTNGLWTSQSGGAGGRLFLNLDGAEQYAFSAIGVNKINNHGLIVHELGHGFGLRHSNNSDEDEDPYDNPWSVMSMVAGYAIHDNRFNELAKHFNAYEKESLGWLDDSEILVIDLDTLSIGSSQTVSLTSIGRPFLGSGTYRMLKLTRGTDAAEGEDGDFYYTVEAREKAGQYEARLPGSGIIMHEVDLRTRRAAWVLDADVPPADIADTDGVIWELGEVYRGDGFNMQVTKNLTTGFEVVITATNGSVDGNSRPFIRPFLQNQQVAVGDRFQLYLFPVDPDGFSPDLIAYNLPLDATLTDNGDGAWIVEWTPGPQDVGIRNITFEAIDRIDDSLRASRVINLEVIDGSVQQTTPAVSTAPGDPARLLGNAPWVTVLCKFADETAEPATAAFVQEMFGDGIGQINHWWKTVSYNRVNLDGSLVLGWYQLPGVRGDYVSGDNSSDDIDDERLTQDCVRAADADVDFSRFYGVNTFFNSAFNSHGVGFGKPRSVTIDDAGIMATTTISLPAWTRQASVIHEMSLASGLPLANNSDLDDNTYDNPWTNMSDGQGHAASDLRYELLAKHLNAYEKYSLGWLDPGEVIELRVDTRIPNGLATTLTPMGKPDQPVQRAIILRDPLLGDSVYYTIEARDRSYFYDSELPGTAVIVHEVDLRRSEPAWIVYDTSDGSGPPTYAASPNHMWTVGETFALPGARVDILSRTSSGFNIRIQTGLDRQPSLTTIGTGSPTNVPDAGATTSDGLDPRDFVLGDQPWVTLLCKFSDEDEEPLSPAEVLEMFGDEPGQMNHYWQLASNGRMSITGSEVLGWYELPGTRADYVGQDFESELLVDDCMSAANDDVDFSKFYGINTFFNGEFNDYGTGTGGKKLVLLDNAGLRGFTALSAPSWTWQAAVAHEMARGMGLTLTNNSDLDENAYDNPWTLMSDSRAYANIDPVYNYMPKFINAHDMEKLGWLDRSNLFDLNRTLLNNGTPLEIRLDSLGVDSMGNNRAIKFIDVTREDNATYYIEARTRGGLYDGSLPYSGVLIHEVVPDREEPAWLYHDPRNGQPSDYADSKDDVLTVGEQVEIDNVIITIAGRTDSGFVLRFYSEKNYLPPGSEVSVQTNGGSTLLPTTGVGSNGGSGSGEELGNTGSNGTLVDAPNLVSNNAGAGGSGGGSGSLNPLLLMLSLIAAWWRLTGLYACCGCHHWRCSPRGSLR